MSGESVIICVQKRKQDDVAPVVLKVGPKLSMDDILAEYGEAHNATLPAAERKPAGFWRFVSMSHVKPGRVLMVVAEATDPSDDDHLFC